MFKFLAASLLTVVAVLHEFHVTHTTLHYNPETESIEITVKVAVEDLERALGELGAEKLRIGEDREAESADRLIVEYFRQRLILSPNDGPADYEWVGKEMSNDLHDIYLYFELPDCAEKGEIKSLVIENSIFTEVLPDQSNIVLVEFGDIKRNLTFSNASSRQLIDLTKD